ncbi:LmeA family phospholipid-binding protein [Mycolicibacterium sp. XJ870]
MTNPPWGHQPTSRPGSAPSPFDDATIQFPRTAAAPPEPAPRRTHRGLKVVLIAALALILVLAGLGAAEWYARNRAESVVSATMECLMGDTATVSLPAMPPFLWQHLTGNYTTMDIHTAGQQIREAKGMQFDITIRDLRLEDGVGSGGTMRSLDANVTWSSEGIKESLQSAIPLLGQLINDVTTNPDDGTLELESLLANVTVKPKVSEQGGIGLDIVDTTGPGVIAVSDLQPMLDAFLASQTDNFPMGVHAGDVDVTETGVAAHFSTDNATMPAGGEDDCFAK